MNEYSPKEIEKFIQLHNANEEENEQSKSLKKLLSVQDKISIFRNIDPQALKAIVYDLKFVKFAFKDYVIEQNDTKSELYFIISGECHVFRDKHKIGVLRAGEIFGETAAIFQTKRNASVVCATKEAVLLSFSIDKENLPFCAPALTTLYKNLAYEINAKLEQLNEKVAKK